MPGQAPLIDRRAYGDLVAEVEALAQEYTAGEVEASLETLTGAVLDQDVVEGPETVATAGDVVNGLLAQRISEIEDLGQVRVKGWQPQDPPDAGSALVRIFGRMAELVIARLNRVPDRDFLAFLDLIGTRPGAPQPARVPLTFHLAAGSPVDTLVPARTQVAATPLEGETEPVLFETERDLVVTRSELVAVFTREPQRDLYRDSTAPATGQIDAIFPVFRGERPIDHRFYIGHAGLLGLPEEKLVQLNFQTGAAPDWLEEVDWELWDGAAWQPVPSTPHLDDGAMVLLSPVPAIPVSEVAGVSSSWLRGRFRTALKRDEVRVDSFGRTQLYRSGLQTEYAVSLGTEGYVPVPAHETFYPFGDKELRQDFYFSLPEAFDRAGAQLEIEILLDESQPPQPTQTLKLQWELLGLGALDELAFEPAEPVLSGDRAEPFLVSGTLRLQVPSHWPKLVVWTLPRRWVRVSVSGGDFYDSSGTFLPPVVKSLRVRSLWPLPEIFDVQMGVRIDAVSEGDQVLPDSGYNNQVPLDLTKDFLPFGEKPKVGDTFYLADEEVFSKPDAAVSLFFELTSLESRSVPPPAAPSDDLVLAWEFWDGRRWQLLGRSGPGGDGKAASNPYQFIDGTEAFTREEAVSFRVPASLAPLEVNGETRRWIRVRIASGNYGVDARYDPIGYDQQERPIYQLVPAAFKPPSVRSVRLGYSYESSSAAPEALLTENDSRFESVLSFGQFQAFVPFRVSGDTRPTLYLGFDRPGDTIGFANRTVALYFGVAGALYDAGTEQAGVLEEAVVVWEHWSGDRWQRLGTRDETRGFTRRGLVTFIGPPDFDVSTQFGRPAFWLRARWERGSYAAEPELRRILTNTMWAIHARTIEDEVLGSSRGERGQFFRTVQSPVLDGQRLEVIEPEMPSALEREDLESEEGDTADTAVRTVLDASGRPAEVRVRWHEVPDFYGSGPRSRHYTLDRSTGEVRFGDGRRGLVPPPGRNNVRMALYRSGGGLAGNRPAGNIVQLRGTVPYVDSVLQYDPAEGGAAEESLAMLEARGPRSLRHRDRAVALADFEDLAVQATTEVARARCIPARDGSDAGTVGLIVVPRSTASKPVPTLELLSRVRSYVEARLSPVVDLWVVGPDWLEVTVAAEVVPQTLEGATDVQTAVLERVTAFLHPLTGGAEGEGWEFGRKPYRSDLFALIEGTPGVDHVRRLEVTELRMEGGARPERFLVYSGEHGITVTGNIDESAEGSGSLA